jgi:hypothetical protein
LKTQKLILIPAENENISGLQAPLTLNLMETLREREVHKPKRGTAMVVSAVMIGTNGDWKLMIALLVGVAFFFLSYSL